MKSVSKWHPTPQLPLLSEKGEAWRFRGVLPESQGHTLALTVLPVPNPSGNGWGWRRGGRRSRMKTRRRRGVLSHKSYMERKLIQNLAGDEVYYTNSSLLLVKNKLCSKLYRQKGFNVIPFWYEILMEKPALRKEVVRKETLDGSKSRPAARPRFNLT